MAFTEREIFLKAMIDANLISKGNVTICNERKVSISANSSHPYICLIFGKGNSNINNYPVESVLRYFRPPSVATHKLRVYGQKKPNDKKTVCGENFTVELARELAKWHYVEVVFVSHTYVIKSKSSSHKAEAVVNMCHCNFNLNKDVGAAIMEWCQLYVRANSIKMNHKPAEEGINHFSTFAGASTVDNLTARLVEMNRKATREGTNLLKDHTYIQKWKKMAHKVNIFVYYTFPSCGENFFNEKLNKFFNYLNWNKISSMSCRAVRAKSVSLVGHFGVDKAGDLWLDFDGALICEIISKSKISLEKETSYMPTLDENLRKSLESGKYVPMQVLLYQLALNNQNLSIKNTLSLDEVPERFTVVIKKADVMRAINIHARMLSKNYSSIAVQYLEFADNIWQLMYIHKFKVEVAIELYNEFWINVNRQLAQGNLIPLDSIPSYLLQNVTMIDH